MGSCSLLEGPLEGLGHTSVGLLWLAAPTGRSYRIRAWSGPSTPITTAIGAGPCKPEGSYRLPGTQTSAFRKWSRHPSPPVSKEDAKPVAGSGGQPKPLWLQLEEHRISFLRVEGG